MKKTIPINIAEILFHIEEDAYQELADYLKSVKEYFQRYAEHDEIVSDIERRIAEQFMANGSKDRLVNKIDVARVIASMGKVEDFAHEGLDDAPHGDSASNSSAPGKKLFRNSDDTIIGGVGSGIAAYFGMDAILVRLAFIVISLFGGYGVLFYIILWFIVPEAKTSSDKIRMRGGKVTLASVEKSVKERVEDLKASRSKFTRGAGVVGGIIRRLVLIFFGIIKVLVRILGFVFMLAGSIAVIGLCIALVTLALNINSPYVDFPIQSALNHWEYYLAIFTAFFIVAVPVAYLAMLGRSVMTLKNKFNRSISLGMLAVWITAVIFGSALAVRIVPKVRAAIENSPAIETVSQTYDIKNFTSVSVGDANTVEIIQGKTFAVVASGRQDDIAQLELINDNGTLKINEHESFKICLFCFDRNVRVQITMPTVDHINASGTSRVTAEKLTQDDLKLTLSGASRVTLSGTAKTLDAKLSGASRVSAPDFVVSDAVVNASGASRLTLHIIKTLNAKLSGASRIDYSGTPKIESDLSGSSRISPANTSI